MNQILFINNNFIDNQINYKKIREKNNYLLIFYVSIIICTLILIYLFFLFFENLNQNKKTNLLKSRYNINTLYSSNINYTSLKFSDNIYIIGSIDIPKINISYPIIENSNKEFLKISVCRFAGPFPNRIGNLCIAGHNYKNNSMFSKLYKLNIGDSIYITDLNNTKLEYIIYDKYNVEENNLDCITNTNSIEVTLITCKTSNNKQRTVIKAKMKGA